MKKLELSALLARCEALGVSVSTRDSHVIAKPAALIDDELRSLLQLSRQEILDHFARLEAAAAETATGEVVVPSPEPAKDHLEAFRRLGLDDGVVGDQTTEAARRAGTRAINRLLSVGAFDPAAEARSAALGSKLSLLGRRTGLGQQFIPGKKR